MLTAAAADADAVDALMLLMLTLACQHRTVPRVFAICSCFLNSNGYFRTAKGEPSQTVFVRITNYAEGPRHCYRFV